MDGQVERSQRTNANLENHINLSSQTTQTLYSTASSSIDHQYTQHKSKHRDLVILGDARDNFGDKPKLNFTEERRVGANNNVCARFDP